MNIDTECEGPGATHHFACKCREEMFEKLRVENAELKSIMVSNGALLYLHKEKLAVARTALNRIKEDAWLNNSTISSVMILSLATEALATIGGGDGS